MTFKQELESLVEAKRAEWTTAATLALKAHEKKVTADVERMLKGWKEKARTAAANGSLCVDIWDSHSAPDGWTYGTSTRESETIVTIKENSAVGRVVTELKSHGMKVSLRTKYLTYRSSEDGEYLHTISISWKD